MSADASLEQLLDRRPDLWRGRARKTFPAASTGLGWLDRGLPGGGWPLGRLTELLPSLSGCGELGLLLPLLARCTQRAEPVVLAGPALVPGPQALISAGVALDHLVVVREASESLWAAEQCLKSGLCGSVVVWPPAGPVGERAVRRLQLAAERSPGPTFVVYRPDQSPPPSVSALRLGLSPGPEVEILRSPSGLVESRCLSPESESVVDLERYRRHARSMQ
ncbi:DNA lesion error-prone repair protein ImuA [Wenzhouxiangella sediminis]|uniref:DNA lesion error-prone repair protein ImuA n=1 Tax=Wenzhouxiangella sediminis TaxID=1792836 RepID=A0A3E1KBX9_9GAMM|nr:DNA lesion error-prone repair protein ImuA [Wenzhouxiangella sediminis]RFF32228.1 DNA lesion error-prone repair protein ImuA [Wenzhouxiangella sediminis]